jgi:hypothetical protein
MVMEKSILNEKFSLNVIINDFIVPDNSGTLYHKPSYKLSIKLFINKIIYSFDRIPTDDTS